MDRQLTHLKAQFDGWVKELNEMSDDNMMDYEGTWDELEQCWYKILDYHRDTGKKLDKSAYIMPKKRN